MRHLPRRLLLAAAAPTGAALRATGRALPGLAGASLVAYGCWLAYRPAGFIVAGLLVLVDAVYSRTYSRRGDA